MPFCVASLSLFQSGLSSAVDSLAGSIDKAAKTVSNDVANVTTNPLVRQPFGKTTLW